MRGLKPRVAAAVVVALVLGCYGVVIAVSERPLVGGRELMGRESRAALVLRDDVTAFQKWGSRLFTWGHVSEEYGAAWYFTDSRDAPVRDAFIAQLDVALATHAEVDLFFLAHHNDYVRWAATLPPERLARVRLVYNTGCRNLDQGYDWIDLGADAFIGHEGLALSPIFYFYFLRRWAHGERLAGAVADANAMAARVLARVGLEAYEPATRAWVIGDESLAIDGVAR